MHSELDLDDAIEIALLSDWNSIEFIEPENEKQAAASVSDESSPSTGSSPRGSPSRHLQDIVPIHEVRDTDVFCGRDRSCHSHPGNIRFRQLVGNYRDQYQNSTQRDDKTRLTNEIMSIVQSCGGRFLKQEEITGEWHQVHNTYAHEKVSHALRSAKDPNRPKAKRVRKAKPPTDDEERAFELLVQEQQTLFAMITSSGVSSCQD